MKSMVTLKFKSGDRKEFERAENFYLGHFEPVGCRALDERREHGRVVDGGLGGLEAAGDDGREVCGRMRGPEAGEGASEMTCAVCKALPERRFPKGSSGQCEDDLLISATREARRLAMMAVRIIADRMQLEPPWKGLVIGGRHGVVLGELRRIVASLEAATDAKEEVGGGVESGWSR